jgi:hypothetical protein
MIKKRLSGRCYRYINSPVVSPLVIMADPPKIPMEKYKMATEFAHAGFFKIFFK